MKLGALLLVALGLLVPFACSTDDEDLSFDVDRAFAPDQRDHILWRLDEWNAITLDHRKLSIDGSVWRVASEDPQTGFNGHCSSRSRRIKIMPELAPELTGVVAKHEFGHAIGLQHLCEILPKDAARTGHPVCGAYSRGVMDPGHVTADFSEADFAECRRVGACAAMGGP